jgi:hypothetical protein
MASLKAELLVPSLEACHHPFPVCLLFQACQAHFRYRLERLVPRVYLVSPTILYLDPSITSHMCAKERTAILQEHFLTDIFKLLLVVEACHPFRLVAIKADYLLSLAICHSRHLVACHSRLPVLLVLHHFQDFLECRNLQVVRASRHLLVCRLSNRRLVANSTVGVKSWLP